MEESNLLSHFGHFATNSVELVSKKAHSSQIRGREIDKAGPCFENRIFSFF